jgi:Protein of unknown function (DUF2927)
MKSSTILLVLGVVIIAVGLAWIISGGMGAPAENTVPQTTATKTVPATVAVTTTVIPSITTPAATLVTVATAAPAVTTSAVPVVTAISADDITSLFLDVAYTSTNRLERVNYNAAKPRLTVVALSAGNDDIALIEKTAKEFNEASQTVKISENIKESGTGDIFIKYLPEDGLSAITLSTIADSGTLTDALTRRELYQGNRIGAKVMRGTVYINANLKDRERKHMLVRGLLYQMGMTGETTKFSDSVFYAGENTNTDLTSSDKKVINILYQTAFYNSMTMDELRKYVYLP